MKKFYRFGLIAIGIFLMSLGLTYWWMRHPDQFPIFPEQWLLWLLQLVYEDDSHETPDVDLLVVFLVSLWTVSLTALSVHLISKWIRERPQIYQSGIFWACLFGWSLLVGIGVVGWWRVYRCLIFSCLSS